MFGNLRRIAALAALGVLLGSCLAPKIESFPTLTNQGQLALSTANPYLGANLFLSRELERSSYLFNFFKGRGAPTAIEILEEFNTAPRILLYYPRDKEVYVADMHVMSRSNNIYQWVVRGPYGIERADYKNLATMEVSMQGEPVFVIRGKEHRFRFQIDDKRDRVLTPLPPPMPTPAPQRKAPKKVIKQPSEPDPRDWRPLNTDQQAIQMSKGFAERAMNGDVIHTVRTPDETLEVIAKWYTGSAGNAGQIAQANHLTPGAATTVGARVLVPLRIAREFKQMPEGYK